MGFESSIRAVFAGDLSKLKESFAEARAEAAKLNAGMGGRVEHKLIGGLIGAEALNKLREFSGEAIKDAQKIRDEFEAAGKPVANDVRTLADFGDGLQNVHQAAVSSVGYLVGGFTQLGDLIGSAINRLRGVSEAQENLGKSSARAAEAQEKALKKLQDANSPEKLAAAEKVLEDARRRALMARLSDEGKLVILLGQESDMQKQLAAHAGETVAHKELEAKLEDVIAQREMLQASLQKKDHDELLKRAEDMNKVADDAAALEKRKHEALLDQMSAEDRLIALKKDEAELVRAINTVGAQTPLGIEFGNELLDKQAAIRQTNLQITEAQAKAEHHVTAAIKEQQITAQGGTAGASRNRIGQASDAELKEMLRRDKEQQVGLRQKSATDLGALLEGSRLGMETQNIQTELHTRDKFRNDVRTGGIEGARRSFQGDPLAFDRLAEQFSKGLGTNDKMLVELEKLNHNVSGLFRNQ